MGMFDYLRCDMPLPVRQAAQGIEYQTKSMDRAMDYYLIREDGSLWVERFDTAQEEICADMSMAQMREKLARRNKRYMPLENFTGEVEFHGGYGTKTPKGWYDGSVRFSAKFASGKLVSVALLHETVSPTELAKEQSHEIEHATPEASTPRVKIRL